MTRTDRYIQLALPKTGSTWLRSVLVKEAGGHDIGGQHDPYWRIPPEKRGDRLIVGTLRNPWEWYTSLYAHAFRNGPAQISQLKQWGGGSAEFKDVLYGWTHPWQVKDIPLSIGVIFAAAGHKPRHIVQSQVGLCTWASRYVYGIHGAAKLPCKATHTTQWGLHLLAATDRLHEAVSSLLERPVGEDTHPRINTRTGHAAHSRVGPDDWKDWYTDPEMKGWVQQADQEIIGIFGWKFGEPAERPLVHVYGVPGQQGIVGVK